MNDVMQPWLPVAEHLQNISLSGLLTFSTILDAEIAMRQESFYNGDGQQNTENSLTCIENGDYITSNPYTKEKKTPQQKARLEVVK